ARPILCACFPRYLGDFVLWNKIANLAQKVKPTTCWFDAFFVFHPCRVAGSKRQANTFFIFCGMAMKLVLRCLPNVLVLIVVAGPMARAGEERKSWNPGKAEAYLDERQNAWFAFSSADRGEGERRTSCVSCHTVLPYVLARPVLRKLVGAETATTKKLLSQTRMRVENWKELDSEAFGLLYDSNARKKKE